MGCRWHGSKSSWVVLKIKGAGESQGVNSCAAVLSSNDNKTRLGTASLHASWSLLITRYAGSVDGCRQTPTAFRSARAKGRGSFLSAGFKLRKPKVLHTFLRIILPADAPPRNPPPFQCAAYEFLLFWHQVSKPEFPFASME